MGDKAMEIEEPIQGEYISIQALENGVSIIGLTRGHDTKFHHTEKLDKGEVMVAQFTQNTSAIKIRGKAIVLTKYGTLKAGME
jgi:transcription attenuation protein (tryptophan RNA-binding attenuator protein)